jgi:UDP-N-acetylglucosamine--N-acetylmuramyl-(pentapeptide) pyrophosphoryl-undecaprenol N-acetylglucosamine transferase
MKNMQSLRVIISGGGTGGHIFPAIAIANAIKKMNAQTEILFVGAKGKMEMEKVPAAGYKIEGLDISGIDRSLSLKNLAFPLRLMKSVWRSMQIIKEFKPDVAVGVGGFASGPLLYAAQLKNVPTLIQEQNSYAGITNKMLGKKANRICVAYNEMDTFFPAGKIQITGNPVRQDILNLEGKREQGIEFFDLNTTKKTLLIIGGSLGAKTINESIAANIEKLSGEKFQVLWQTGKLFFPTAKKAVENNNTIKAHDFVTKMDLAYAVADVVVSRAGASSISELCIVKKPAILIPFPFAAEDHQTKNAMALVTKQAAILIKDSEAKERLLNEILLLMNDEAKQELLKKNIGELALANADEVIANEVIKLATAQKN